jgi:GNAT superfamily N-acetyltransferase
MRDSEPQAPTGPPPPGEPDQATVHRLADGTRVRTRPIGPADREKLRNGFLRLSPESKYRRFFAAPATLTDDMLRHLTATDGWNHVAIGAELADEDAKADYGLGIARFFRLPEDPTKAEAAVAVIDEVQGQGLGRLLLSQLIAAARARGIRTFICYVLPSNEPAKTLLQGVAEELSPRLDDGVLVYELALPEVIPTEPDQGPIYRLFRLAAEGISVIFRHVPGVG